MAELRVRHTAVVEGTVRVPGDKSISHRALILGALARGRTVIHNWLAAADCWSTRRCLAGMGVAITDGPDGEVQVEGGDPAEPEGVLDCGNSGTSMRLLLGVLAGRPGFAVLDGDASLRRRPMRRVTEPLRAMGARVDGRAGGDCVPLAVRGGQLHGVSWRPEVASAQVKSAILLAGLHAAGETAVIEPVPTRDHTERMLRAFGASVAIDGRRVSVRGGQSLTGRVVQVPGDLSAAAFLFAAAAIVPGGRVTVPAVGINPGRTGFLEALAVMGAGVHYDAPREVAGEPVADVTVTAPNALRGVSVGGDLIPRLIDEIPVLSVVAAFARDQTVIRDANDLRNKESDRLAVMARQLERMGAHVEELPDGLVVSGGGRLQGAEVGCAGDHRVAMALAVAGLGAEGETIIDGAESVAISFPEFERTLGDLVGA